MRKRELSLLRAIGAHTEDIKRAVIPETVADYTVGAFVSIMLGALGFVGLMTDGGGVYDVVSIMVICLIFLAGSVFVQVRISGRMTEQVLAESGERL